MKDYRKHWFKQKNNLTNSNGNMYLAVDFLIEINNKTAGLSNITLRKSDVK